ncbi:MULTISPECIES: TetR/AcrR family transcriptional regulator [Leptotrichia]|uniref:TetR/AcrR family transcriptional regulator n=1 Tax=Leptotrichia TaxID=32067 RepID=UPI0003AE071B|nr:MULTISPECIES: TetR/AcrR family transcriptional regulator [Leptotrichia]ERL25140.1 transcriptional regulator, TetR family [Leptotrichia sp. oral taxon 225 str. F0581]WLD73621.1 TetR/AcrR family transcriptional regulator [Leptotrichia sp. HMT-225]
MINYEDIRIKKTIRNIHKSFIELFKGKDYEKITVKELIEKAEISKKTFYRYYSSIDNLFLEIQDKITNEYIQKFSLLSFPEDLKNIINTFIDFSEIYGNAHDKIIIDSKNDYVLQKMINNIIKKTWEKSDFFKETEPYLRNIILSFVFSSILGSYKQWINDGKKIPLQNFIDTIESLVYNGIKNFDSNNYSTNKN